jgi:hypothetical protein
MEAGADTAAGARVRALPAILSSISFFLPAGNCVKSTRTSIAAVSFNLLGHKIPLPPYFCATSVMDQYTPFGVCLSYGFGRGLKSAMVYIKVAKINKGSFKID